MTDSALLDYEIGVPDEVIQAPYSSQKVSGDKMLYMTSNSFQAQEVENCELNDTQCVNHHILMDCVFSSSFFCQSLCFQSHYGFGFE